MTATFDASKYLRNLGGKDYLEVKWRLLWLRTEHPEAVIDTELLRLDTEAGFALFKAKVVLIDGEASGHGSETARDFGDYIEKAETKAIGRALAALGYGTQFCEDHDMINADGSPHVVDSPVEPLNGTAKASTNGTAGKPLLATPAQLRLIYLTATRDLHITEEDLEERCQSRYGRLPLQLTKREASEFIDSLKAKA